MDESNPTFDEIFMTLIGNSMHEATLKMVDCGFKLIDTLHHRLETEEKIHLWSKAPRIASLTYRTIPDGVGSLRRSYKVYEVGVREETPSPFC